MNRRLISAAWFSCAVMLFGCGRQSSAQSNSTNSSQAIESVSKIPAYRVGLRSIVVPSPAELQETGPDFRVLFERLAPDSNRLVAAFIPAGDIAKLPAGSADGLARYALLETLRQAEFADIDETIFKQAKELIAKQFGTTVDAPAMDTKAIQDELNHRFKEQGYTGQVSLDKPVALGVFFSKADAIGFGMLMDVNSGGKTQKMIGGMALIRSQGRLLYTYIFTHYAGDDSAAWVRTTSEQWADAILKANP